MKSSQSASFRMDERVMFTMAAVCLLAIVIFAFRYAGDKPCNNVTIRFPADSVFINDVVSFSVDKNAGKEFVWDFGDGTLSNDKAALVTHIYKDARAYTVRVTVDNTCTGIQTVWVAERKKSFTPPSGPQPNYPSTALVDVQITLQDVSSASKSWEWYFDESPDVFSRERSVPYTFKSPGTHKFIVKTNGKDDLAFTGFIVVSPKAITETPVNNGSGGGGAGGGGGKRNPTVIVIPEKPTNNPVSPDKNQNSPDVQEPVKPDPAKAKQGTDISPDQMGDLLYKVYKGSKSATDFKDYACDNTIQVSDDKGKQYTLSEFCAMLQSLKKVKDVKVTMLNKNSNNCISSIRVTIKYKTILGIKF